MSSHVAPRLALLAACALASGAQAAPAAPPAPAVTPRASAVPEAAQSLLASPDVPLTAELIARVGLTESAAAEVLADGQARRYLRIRALSALPFFGTPSARALVDATAAGDADEIVRVQAVTSLSRGFGLRDRIGVETRLKALSKDAPPVVAEAIAGELAWLAAAPAQPAPAPLAPPAR